MLFYSIKKIHLKEIFPLFADANKNYRTTINGVSYNEKLIEINKRRERFYEKTGLFWSLYRRK